MDQLISTRRSLWLVLGLTTVAAMTRFYGLGEWNLHNDELYTFWHASERYNRSVNPAYYALVVASWQLLGVTEWATRLPAAILGVLAVPLFYITWRKVIGNSGALIGALLVIVSSWHLYYSQFGRHYTGVFLFASLSYFFYYRALVGSSLGYLGGALLTGLVAVLFHASAALVLVSCAVFSLVVAASPTVQQQGYSKRIAVTHLLVCAVIGLLLTPFLLDLLINWQAKGLAFGRQGFMMVLELIRRVELPIAVAACLGLMLLVTEDRTKALFFAVLIGVPFAALFAGRSFVAVRPVYVFYVLPLIFVLAGYLCDRARCLIEKNVVKSHALTVVVITSLLIETVSHYTDMKTVDVREAVAVVKQFHQADDKVLSFSKEFKHYVGAQYPVEPSLGSPLKDRHWQKILAQYEHKRQRVWIVFPMYRNKPLAKELSTWLAKHAHLVWRKQSKRYDYSIRGYEIFLANGDFSGNVRNAKL